MKVPYTAPTSITEAAKTPSAVRDGRRERTVPVAARPGSMANTTQLHAVNVAARPATAANRKPNPNPFCANVTLSAVGSPRVCPATTLRPNPSASRAFQNPATSRPPSMASTITVTRRDRLYVCR